MKGHRWVSLVYLSFLLLGGILMLWVDKKTLHLYFNHFHTPFFDIFFRYVTKLAEPLVIGLLIVVSGYVMKWRAAIFILLANALSTVVTYALKYYIFEDIDRPKTVFKGIAQLYFIPGVDVHIYNSFPSGHTAAAFATYVSLMMITDRCYLKWLWFFIAILVALSRIYLSQHFFIDTYFGSLLGTLCALFLYRLFYSNSVKGDFA